MSTPSTSAPSRAGIAVVPSPHPGADAGRVQKAALLYLGDLPADTDLFGRLINAELRMAKRLDSSSQAGARAGSGSTGALSVAAPELGNRLLDRAAR